MEQVADVEASVLPHKSPKNRQKLDNVSPALTVIQHLFLRQNEAISFVPGNDWTALLRKRYRNRQEATATLSFFALHVHETCTNVKKCLLKDSWGRIIV